jgi:hypothetical protein
LRPLLIDNLTDNAVVAQAGEAQREVLTCYCEEKLMYSEVYLMCAGVVIAIVALLSSKFVRAICREAIFHPRQRCEIQARGGKVSVKRGETEHGREG